CEFAWHSPDAGSNSRTESAGPKNYRGELAGSLQRRRWRLPETRPDFSFCAAGGTTASGRLAGALSNVRRRHKERSHSRERAGGRRNRLRPDKSRSRATRAALGKTGWNSQGRAALLADLRTAAMGL